jgi:hypothetical protein
MNKYFFRSLALVSSVLSVFVLFLPQVWANEKALKEVRPSAIAGSWYPGTRNAVKESVQKMLSGAQTPRLDGTLKALVVPHAGHRYSGGVAAHAYSVLKENQFKRIILVGPSHYLSFRGISINLQSGYETPLGIVPVDQEMARKIMDADSNIRSVKQAHAREHSLEIQLPFLQTVLRNFKIVPIIMGQQDYETCSNLANTLAKVLRDANDTLILASSDLSHFHPYGHAKALDLNFIEHVRRLDPQGLEKDLSAGKCEACGRGPVITALLASKALGADRAVILNYANSGDVTGDHGRVVGYLSAALIKSSDTGPHQ